MHLERRLTTHLGRLVAAVAMLLAGVGPAAAADPTAATPPDAVMLVATPALSDPLYGATVLVAHPIGGGQFIGFIINKPTRITVAQAFPGHVPSQKVKAPIFLGGPENAQALFALVHSEQSPGQGSLQLMPDLFVVMAGATVDQVIEHDPEHARFLIGTVLLRPGVVTRAQLSAACGQAVLSADGATDDAPRAPGTLASHYAPNAKVRLMDAKAIQTALDLLGADAAHIAAKAGRAEPGEADDQQDHDHPDRRFRGDAFGSGHCPLRPAGIPRAGLRAARRRGKVRGRGFAAAQTSW